MRTQRRLTKIFVTDPSAVACLLELTAQAREAERLLNRHTALGRFPQHGIVQQVERRLDGLRRRYAERWPELLDVIGDSFNSLAARHQRLVASLELAAMEVTGVSVIVVVIDRRAEIRETRTYQSTADPPRGAPTSNPRNATTRLEQEAGCTSGQKPFENVEKLICCKTSFLEGWADSQAGTSFPPMAELCPDAGSRLAAGRETRPCRTPRIALSPSRPSPSPG